MVEVTEESERVKTVYKTKPTVRHHIVYTRIAYSETEKKKELVTQEYM